MTEQELLGQHQFGTVSNGSVWVGTDTTTILAANSDRKYAGFWNNSDSVLSLALGADAVADQGVRLGTAGGERQFNLTWENLYAGAISGIHSESGTKLVSFIEGS